MKIGDKPVHRFVERYITDEKGSRTVDWVIFAVGLVMMLNALVLAVL